MARVPLPDWYAPSPQMKEGQEFLGAINRMLPFMRGPDVPWAASYLYAQQEPYQGPTPGASPSLQDLYLRLFNEIWGNNPERSEQWVSRRAWDKAKSQMGEYPTPPPPALPFQRYLEAEPVEPVGSERERLVGAREALTVGPLGADEQETKARQWLQSIMDFAIDYTKGTRRTRKGELELGRGMEERLKSAPEYAKGFAPFMQRLIMPSVTQAPPGTSIYSTKAPRGVWTVPNPAWY